MSTPTTEDIAALRLQVRDFLADELARGSYVPRCDAWLAGWDEDFSRRLADRGWVGMTLPEEYGGHGRTTLERYAVTEELLAAGAPVAAHWFSDRQIGPSLLRHGTEAQRQRFLPSIASGECFFGIGMSEPDSGSDLASVRTRGTPCPGGWLVSGTKVWTSGAHKAHFFFVLARTTPWVEGESRHAGLSQFIIALDDPGVSVRPILLLTGEHHFNEVVLTDVFVPDEMVLGQIGDGWLQVTSELAFERSGPERFLSTYPLLAALVAAVAAHPRGRGRQELGVLLSRLWVLRQMSLDIAASLSAGIAQEVPAAVVKDLGTSFEVAVVAAATLLLDIEPDLDGDDGLARLLAEAALHAPGFTIRGGTSEILRGLIARGVGVR